MAVIGAGAAGLVAARHFLWNKCSSTGSVANLHIFERRGWVGGAWSSRGGSAVGKPKDSAIQPPSMWENLTPNLSKYTCRFSDFPWPEGTPTFPSRADMQKYLEDYADRFVLQNEHCTLHYECTVTNVQKSDDHTYKLYWKNETDFDNNSFCKAFDNVIVASGYFAAPIWPDGILNLVDSTAENKMVTHSSQYQSPEEFSDQSVCIIGGSFSAQEIASDVARYAKRVVNILGTDLNHSVPYILPRLVPDPQTGLPLPLDVLLYRRSDRQVAPAIPEKVALDDEEIQRRHDFLRHLVGNRFFEQLMAKEIPEPSVSTYPFVSISDEYANLVVDGKIDVIPCGRVENAKKCDKGSGLITVTLDNGSMVEGVDRIIACTGYRSCLDFLDSEILQTLEYDPSDSFAPLTLCCDAFHPKLPGLGFVGQYKGAYFGYMELQARLLAGMQNGQVELGNNDGSPDEISQNLLEHARQVRQQQPRPQFPHFDYVGAMDSLAERVQLTPDATTFGANGQMVTPAYYQPDMDLAKQCQEELEHEMQSHGSTKIARLALHSMIGKWKFRRTITDHLTCSEQDVHGEVSFSGMGEPHVLRYREDGHLDLPNGNRLEVFREYDYVWNRGSGDLDIMFVENGQQTYLFMSLRFQKQENEYWLASSDHLCIKDLYKGTFQIKLEGIRAKEIMMIYHVKGPKKDYESVTYLSPTIN